MRVINDFHCPKCDTTFEEYMDSDIQETPCKCGGTAKKALAQTSYFKIDGFRMDINSSQWADARVKNGRRTHGG